MVELESVGAIIDRLITLADEFDEECGIAASVGYDIEYALGTDIPVDVNLLRKLRELTIASQSSKAAPEYPPACPREQRSSTSMNF